MRFWPALFVAALAALFALAQAFAEQGYVIVEAKRKPSDAAWREYKTVLLEHIAGYRLREEVPLSRFGGWRERRVKSTGFFRTEKVGGTWWLVDPEGCLFFSVGVCSVNINPTARGRAALAQKFGGFTNWAKSTSDLLWRLGFNTLGCWSDWEAFRTLARPMPYTTQLNFMSTFGKQLGRTFQLPGHAGYPKSCILVFHPGFARFCEEHAAKLLASTRDDPFLLGHFSDNEMPLPRDALDRFMSLDHSDPGYVAAANWVREHNVRKGPQGFAAEAREAFLQYLVATYYRIVSAAIKKADPNHLYLGSRFHGSDLRQAAVFRGCAPYIDVVAVNYYHAWTPDAQLMDSWLAWAQKPFLITEWYAKGMDSGMPNNTGAGWVVKTQADRGRFYQNFALGLLAHPGCVGWHWFKYMDNDPTNKAADPSNRDSNKGIVSNTYDLYQPLAQAMEQLNSQVYPLRQFLLARKP